MHICVKSYCKKVPPKNLLALVLMQTHMHTHTNGTRELIWYRGLEASTHTHTHTCRQEHWGRQAHLAVYSVKDVNVLLTLPPQDPAVIKAFLETWLLCSLRESARKNITASGDTGILITLCARVCKHAYECVCACIFSCILAFLSFFVCSGTANVGLIL